MLQRFILKGFIASLAMTCSLTANATNATADYLLPDNLTIYVKDKTVLNHPAPGFEARTLLNNNDFQENPGCYVACYSHDTKNIAYSIDDTIHVKGQVRVSGNYQGRICLPSGYEKIDISADNSFKTLCSTKIAACKDIECWAGGDTGGWFGIQ